MSEHLERPDRGRGWAGRYEEEPLLRGQGRYGDDVKPETAAAAAFVRSTHAFANLGAIDADAARAHPGVLAVLTGADLAPFGFDTVSRSIPFPGRGGKHPVSPLRPVLAGERVVHVGQPLALGI